MPAGRNGESGLLSAKLIVANKTLDTGRTITLRVRCIGFSQHRIDLLIGTLRPAEPLRRGDLLNAINKLAGEKAASKHRRKLRPALAISDAMSMVMPRIS